MGVHEREQLRDPGVVAGVIEDANLHTVKLVREVEDAER